jgi:uncharacterized membrane protein YadS
MAAGPVKEQVQQKAGAHKWMVGFGVACLTVAIILGFLTRVFGSKVTTDAGVTTTKS